MEQIQHEGRTLKATRLMLPDSSPIFSQWYLRLRQLQQDSVKHTEANSVKHSETKNPLQSSLQLKRSRLRDSHLLETITANMKHHGRKVLHIDWSLCSSMLVNKTENAWSNHESKDGLEEIDQVEKRRARVDRKQDLPKQMSDRDAALFTNEVIRSSLLQCKPKFRKRVSLNLTKDHQCLPQFSNPLTALFRRPRLERSFFNSNHSSESKVMQN